MEAGAAVLGMKQQGAVQRLGVGGQGAPGEGLVWCRSRLCGGGGVLWQEVVVMVDIPQGSVGGGKYHKQVRIWVGGATNGLGCRSHVSLVFQSCVCWYFMVQILVTLAFRKPCDDRVG